MQMPYGNIWQSLRDQLTHTSWEAPYARQLQSMLATVRQRWGERPPEATPSDEAPRKVGLALGGGGGKGGAHLGVLHALEKLDVPIDAIAGTSVGAAIGILYAAGLGLNEIAELFRASAIRRIAAPDPTRTGFISNAKRAALLTSVLGDKTFADLPIPCAVVATDLLSGRQVVLDQGPLVPAILASSAIPGVFTPVAYGDMLLADGGVLNNVPVDVAHRLGAQRVVAVQLVAGDRPFTVPTQAPEQLLSRLTLAPQQLAVADRALDLLVQHATKLHLEQHPPAVLIQPPVGEIGTLDMTSTEAGWQVGEYTTQAAATELLALRAWREGRVEPKAAQAPRNVPIAGLLSHF
jgi:NTE family protein